MTTRTVIIIGFGPAGMACAIQLKRMGLSPLVIEKGEPGGMLPNAYLIENYLGFPQGIPGDKLAEIFREQASRFEIEVVKDEIRAVDYRDNHFILNGARGDFSSSRLVIATGTEPVWPGEISSELMRTGLIHAEIAKLKHVHHKSVGIIGAGDAAFDYALNLAQRENDIRIFNRSARVKSLRVLQEKISRTERITCLANHVLQDLNILQNNKISAKFRTNMDVHEYVLDYLIFATGRVPALNFIGTELKACSDRLQAGRKLYFIGDVNNGKFRQVSAAVGDGIKTAMEIYLYESNNPD